MYIKVNDTKYQLLNYSEDVEDIDRTNNNLGEQPQVLYAKMIISFDGDIIQLRNDVRNQLRKDGYVFTIYNENHSPAFSYERAYHKMARRNVNVETGEYSTTELILKIYLDAET